MPLIHLPPVIRHIPERPLYNAENAFPMRLGRHVEHDPRSRMHAHTHDAAQPLTSQEWKHYGSPLNQGDIGSCTGNAETQALNCAPFCDGSKILTETDAVRLYSEATHVDGIPGVYPPTDTGSSGLAVCKAAKKEGLITGYRHAFSLQALLSWLSTRGPAIIGIEWFSSFDNPAPDGRLTIGGVVRGGHEVCLLGIDVPNRLVKGINSWGAWGPLKGYFFFDWDTLTTLLKRQGDATLPYR